MIVDSVFCLYEYTYIYYMDEGCEIVFGTKERSCKWCGLCGMDAIDLQHIPRFLSCCVSFRKSSYNLY
jgi:hypothetical protein